MTAFRFRFRDQSDQKITTAVRQCVDRSRCFLAQTCVDGGSQPEKTTRLLKTGVIIARGTIHLISADTSRLLTAAEKTFQLLQRFA